jgi:hypothetical protein
VQPPTLLTVLRELLTANGVACRATLAELHTRLGLAGPEAPNRESPIGPVGSDRAYRRRAFKKGLPLGRRNIAGIEVEVRLATTRAAARLIDPEEITGRDRTEDNFINTRH